jgi:O-methyltransferase
MRARHLLGSALRAANARRPEARLRRRYLDLLERAVTHTLYHPPDAGEPPEFAREAFTREFERLGIEIEYRGPGRARIEGRDWPVYALTMSGLERTRNVRRCAEAVVAERVPGDMIEAGAWRGGLGILMRGVLEAYRDARRTVWVADSFQGVPPPNAEAYPADERDENYTAEQLAVSRAEVEASFRRFGLLDERVCFLEGWFRDTLPRVRDRRWAVVRLDGDLYESTMDGLQNLYPGLSVGGYLIVDDFGFPNCRAAVEDYRREQGIAEPIERVDWTGVFWRRRE